MESRGTIVVVDDEADVARYLTAALEDEGYEVFAGSDAAEGLRLIREKDPGLVCLDLVMPGRTGISLYREIIEIEELKGIPIVVVTGVAPRDAEERLGLGRDLPMPAGYIEKPVDIPQFLSTIDRLISVKGGQP